MLTITYNPKSVPVSDYDAPILANDVCTFYHPEAPEVELQFSTENIFQCFIANVLEGKIDKEDIQFKFQDKDSLDIWYYAKLNEYCLLEFPDGVQTINPWDVSIERTRRILENALAFFDDPIRDILEDSDEE